MDTNISNNYRSAFVKLSMISMSLENTTLLTFELILFKIWGHG